MRKLSMLSIIAIAVCLSYSFTENDLSSSIDKTTAVPGEQFQENLYLRLRSVDDVIDYVDSAIGEQNRTTLAYSDYLANTLRKRFFHGYSYYSFKDNWIAWLSGVIIWDDLNAIVIPDDILKHPNAACSQQAIVLSACFEKIGVPYREVNLVGHFALEGNINNQWYYFDTNLEPRFINQRSSLNNLLNKNELFPSYENKRSREDLKLMFSAPVYKSENAPIAAKAKIFHKVTNFLSLTILLLLPAAAYVVYRQRKDKVAIS